MRGVRLTVLLVMVVAEFSVASAVGALRPLAAVQPVLRVGSRGPVVAAWQQVVNEWLGTAPPRDAQLRAARAAVAGRLQVDGVFGPLTLVATREWQRDAHLRPTGVVTLRTWVAWIGGNVTCCGAGLPGFTARALPSRSDAYVGWWQVALDRWRIRHRLHPLVVTGLYDVMTRAATATFQKGVGLPGTGIANRATWTLMQQQPGGLAPT
jgi:peptidoglycan hydrolase-like protein with peptidoglycan-binding domain